VSASEFEKSAARALILQWAASQPTILCQLHFFRAPGKLPADLEAMPRVCGLLTFRHVFDRRLQAKAHAILRVILHLVGSASHSEPHLPFSTFTQLSLSTCRLLCIRHKRRGSLASTQHPTSRVWQQSFQASWQLHDACCSQRHSRSQLQPPGHSRSSSSASGIRRNKKRRNEKLTTTRGWCSTSRLQRWNFSQAPGC